MGLAHQFSAITAASASAVVVIDDDADQLDECESKSASLMLFTIDLNAKSIFYLREQKPNKKSWQVIKRWKTSEICIRAALSHREMPPLAFVPTIVAIRFKERKIKISNKTIQRNRYRWKKYWQQIVQSIKRVYRSVSPLLSFMPFLHRRKKLISLELKLFKCTFLLSGSS